jgi:methylated-DNA-[protein]-cysteine S-methyltransferase
MSEGKPAGIGREDAWLEEAWLEETAVEEALMGRNGSRPRRSRYAASVSAHLRRHPAIPMSDEVVEHGGAIVTSPIGTLAIGRRKGHLVADWIVDGASAPPCASDDHAAFEAASSVRAYFEGDFKSLNAIPVGEGTPFQRKVWTASRRIPFGETRTYLWIAREIGGGHALCRAIGQALRRNPLPVIVPCHRVVAASGLGGYAGAREGALTNIKYGLIEFEARYVAGV